MYATCRSYGWSSDDIDPPAYARRAHGKGQSTADAENQEDEFDKMKEILGEQEAREFEHSLLSLQGQSGRLDEGDCVNDTENPHNLSRENVHSKEWQVMTSGNYDEHLGDHLKTRASKLLADLVGSERARRCLPFVLGRAMESVSRSDFREGAPEVLQCCGREEIRYLINAGTFKKDALEWLEEKGVANAKKIGMAALEVSEDADGTRAPSNKTSADEDHDAFSDVDDNEINRYINSEEEAQWKYSLWREMNSDWLEKQAQRQQYRDRDDEMKRNKKRRLEPTVPSDASSAREAASAMLETKESRGTSSKINYEALATLFDHSSQHDQNSSRLMSGSPTPFSRHACATTLQLAVGLNACTRLHWVSFIAAAATC